MREIERDSDIVKDRQSERERERERESVCVFVCVCVCMSSHRAVDCQQTVQYRLFTKQCLSSNPPRSTKLNQILNPLLNIFQFSSPTLLQHQDLKSLCKSII